MLAFVGKQARILLQQVVGFRDHMAEGAQVVFLQHALDDGKDAGDFPAAAEDFLVGEYVFRLADTGDRQLTTADATNVVTVFFRADHLVLTSPHEVDQVIEKLGDISGTNEVVEMELANAAAKVNPEVLIIEDVKFLPAAGQQVIAVGMESGELKISQVDAAEFGFYPFTHFVGSVVGVSQGEDLAGAGVLFAKQVRDPAGQDSRLAGARAGDHEHRSVDVLDALDLAVIRLERNGLQGGHWAGAYQISGLPLQAVGLARAWFFPP